MSEMQDAFEAEKANSDKAFDMYIEAQATIEAQSKLIEDLRRTILVAYDNWDMMDIREKALEIRAASPPPNPHSEKVE